MVHGRVHHQIHLRREIGGGVPKGRGGARGDLVPQLGSLVEPWLYLLSLTFPKGSYETGRKMLNSLPLQFLASKSLKCPSQKAPPSVTCCSDWLGILPWKSSGLPCSPPAGLSWPTGPGCYLGGCSRHPILLAEHFPQLLGNPEGFHLEEVSGFH